MQLSKILTLAGIAALVLLFFVLDLGRFLSLSYLQQSQAGFAAVLRPACLDSSTLNQRIRKDPPGRNVRAGASG